MDAKEASNFLLDMVGGFKEQGKSGSYVANCIKPIKNWLAFSGVFVQTRIEITNRHKLQW
jgi:hypothetical protein